MITMPRSIAVIVATIRWANRYSTGTWSASVGTLYASATLWMGRGIPGDTGIGLA